ncbi:hypothetical protein [Pedobacter paludis]|nr:hypothetical protein [Pedobacter paludis]
MKNLELTNFGVQELDAKEMRMQNGGFIGELAIGMLCLAASWIYETGKKQGAEHHNK